MGLNASSDEWCCQSDIIIEGLPWARKIVDDTIIWADTEKDLEERVLQVLMRCRESGITISQKKLQIGKSIHFAGHIISDKGIRPDDEKYAAIKRFPSPKDVKDLRSFLGLATQLGSFIPDLAHITNELRPLLKKGIAWQWTEDTEEHFVKAKNLLTSHKTIVHPFDPEATTQLLTDASRLHGIGFTLMQRDKEGIPRLIQCGSSALTPTQQLSLIHI